MHFVLSSPKWIDRFLSTNHLHTFANSLFKTFSISVMSLCWYKKLVPPAYRYAWPIDRAHGVSFIYSKNNKPYNMNPWGTPQLMVPASEFIHFLMKQKKFSCSEKTETIAWSTKTMHFILSNKTLWYKMLQAFWRSIKIIPVCFPFSGPFKILWFNRECM